MDSKLMKRLSILTISLLIGISAITACGSAEKVTNEQATSRTGQTKSVSANDKVSADNKKEEKTFEITNASKFFDVKISVAECGEGYCRGKAEFSFFKKGENTMPYQVINLDSISIRDTTSNNTTLLYDKQSFVTFDDFNFDGMEDVAVSDGTNGTFASFSYSIYLSSKTEKRFVYNKDLSDLGENYRGSFNVDGKTKTLSIAGHRGCCLHFIRRFKVVNNRPVKVFSETADATGGDKTKAQITTETLVNGKLKKSVRYEKHER